MKKPKFKFDSAAMQKFMVLHCEKIVLVAVLGIMAWLVYKGYSLPGLDPTQTPSALASKSDSTKKFIDEPTRWTAVVLGERQVPLDLQEKTGVVQTPSDPSHYPVPIPWKPENFPKLSPRTDPTLLPPEHLIVHPVIGQLFSNFVSDEEIDPTYPQEEIDETKPKRPPLRKKRPPRGAPGDMYSGGYPGATDMAESGGYGGGYPGGSGRTARRSSRRSGSDDMADRGGSAGGSAGMSASAGMAGSYGGDMSDMGGMSGYGAASGMTDPESIQGFQGNSQAGIGRHAMAMVVTAVVPYAKQIEEFANALNSSLDYDLNRDQPQYLGLLVERAEVPADNLSADADSLDWKSINVKAAKMEQYYYDPTPPGRLGQWAGVLTEVIDPSYYDLNLTNPAPPFMQRKVWPLLTHPDVPLAPLANAGMYDGSMRPKAPVPGAANEKPVEDVPTFPGGVPGQGGYPGSGYGGYSGGSGGSGGDGYGGMPGMTSGGMPGGMMSGGMPGGMMSGSAGMSGSMGSYPMGDSGYGAGSYGSGGGYGGYGPGMNLAPPKFKLVRFTDTHVAPGKHYRYRLKVQLHDPNHPAATFLPPTLASLDPEVQKRITQLDAEDKTKKEMAPGVPWRTYWVESGWSQPSDVVTLPLPSSFYAGSIEQPSATEIVQGKPRLQNAQPQVKVLVSVSDPVKVVDVPAEETAYRGSTLNFVKDTKVIHPVDHVVIDYKEYKFQTGGVVTDLMGGEAIPKRNKSNSADPLKAPSEILVFDAAGKLRVRNETEDIEEFRRILVPEPDPMTQPGGMPGAEPYPGGSNSAEYDSQARGYPGGSGSYPGGSGRGRPTRGSRGSSSSGGP